MALLLSAGLALPAGAAVPAGVGEKPKPQMMLIGVQKAATTSVWSLLAKANMGVCGSKHQVSSAGTPKENHFFDMDEKDFPYTNTYEKYSSQFSGHSCTSYLDATPAYLYEGYGPSRMVAMNHEKWHKQVKFLVIIREPIARDLAYYNHMKENWWANGKKGQQTDMGDIETHLCEKATHHSFPSYRKAVKCKVKDWRKHCRTYSKDRSKNYHYCALYSGSAAFTSKEVEKKTGFAVRKNRAAENRLLHGFYKPQIRSYSRKFDRSRILVLDFDRMLNNQEMYIKFIVEHYGLPYAEHKHKLKTLPEENEKKFPGKVKHISCSTRRKLEAVYSPYNKDLFKYMKKGQRGNAVPGHEPNIEYRTKFITQVDCEEGGELVYDENPSNDWTTGGNVSTVLIPDEEDIEDDPWGENQLENEEDGFFDGDDAEDSATNADRLADDGDDDDGDGKAAESANSTATTTATTKPPKGSASAGGDSMVPPA